MTTNTMGATAEEDGNRLSSKLDDDRPDDGLPSSSRNQRISERAEDKLCEAYVTLGRLSYATARHGEDMAVMVKALVNAGVQEAVDSAKTKVRSEYDDLKNKVAELYHKSIEDLKSQKRAVEGPTRARVELMTGQQNVIEKVEAELRAVMEDEESLLRELPEVLRRANKTLKSSLHLMMLGLRLPEIKRITAEGFPPSRLRGVVIASEQSGDLARSECRDGLEVDAMTTPAPTKARTPWYQRRKRELQEKNQPHQQQHQQLERAPLESEEDGSLSSPTAVAVPEAASAAVAASATVLEEESAPAARGSEVEAEVVCGRGCCRAPVRWDDNQERPMGEGDVGEGAPVGAPEACSHCACACRADDVWAAYRTLRKRYHALKDQVDKEEARLSIEEQRREMQSEFDKKKCEMQAEFEEATRRMDAELDRMSGEMIAVLSGKNVMAEVAEATAGQRSEEQPAASTARGLTEAETESLRRMAEASIKECQAVQQEAAELRTKVALGEQSLQEALQETLILKADITRRKQHGEILRARIRYLKGKTNAYMKNYDGRAGTRGPRPPAESDCGRDSDINAIARRRMTDSRRDDRGSRLRSPDSSEDSDIEVSDDSAVHHHAFSRYCRDGLGEDDYRFSPELKRERGPPGGGEGSRLFEARTNSEGGRGDLTSRNIERERERLTREVFQLSARLAASEVTPSSTSLAPSDLDSDLNRVFIDGSIGKRGSQEEAATAASAAVEAAVRAAEIQVVSRNHHASRRGDAVGTGKDGDGEGGRRRAGTRHRRHLASVTPNVWDRARRTSPWDTLTEESDGECSTSGS